MLANNLRDDLTVMSAVWESARKIVSATLAITPAFQFLPSLHNRTLHADTKDSFANGYQELLDHLQN